MPKLDRYLLGEILVPFAASFVGLMGFWVFGDLIERLDSFESASAGPEIIAAYYFQRTPEFLILLTPIAFLFALLFTMTRLCRANELVAMRAAGMSLQRIMTPYLGLALALAALIAGAQEFLAPQAQRNLELMRSAIDGDEDPSEVAAPAVDIYHQSEGRVWNIDAFHRNEERMRGVDVQWTTSDGRSIRIIADSATWDGRQWVFEQGREFLTANADSQSPVRRSFEQRPTPELTSPPEYFEGWLRLAKLDDPRQIKEIALSLRQIAQLESTLDVGPSEKRTQLRARRHANLTTPLSPVVIAILGAPFAAYSHRRDLFVGVANTLLLGIFYLYCHRLLLPLGASGRLPPILAAWIPHAAFITFGTALIARARFR